VFAVGSLSTRAVAQSADVADDAEVVVSDTSSADADLFVVPDGPADKLIEFIEFLAQRDPQATTPEEQRAYFDQVSTAIGNAADKIIAMQATDQQAVDAIEWKIESLRIRGMLGDADADAQTEKFLDSLSNDTRPAVAEAVEKIRDYRREMQFVEKWRGQLRTLPLLPPAQRAAVIDELVDEVKSDDVFANQVVVLVQFCDLLADSDDAAPVKRATDELLPLFRASDDPGIVERLPRLEGITRRLNLPGNRFELSGELLDGSMIDWDAYRGKVVLIDYWATWCQPCLAEVPNVVENYRKYHSKGFDVVGISLDDDKSQVEQYLREANIPWATMFHTGSEESGWSHPMAIKYGVIGIPRAILVDQQGNVVNMNARGRNLSAELQRLLGEPAVDASSAVARPNEAMTARSERP
jgi:thiol-disulfide isomerase/thioredoxin